MKLPSLNRKNGSLIIYNKTIMTSYKVHNKYWQINTREEGENDSPDEITAQ